MALLLAWSAAPAWALASPAPALPDAEALVRVAETHRGFSRPYAFVARIRKRAVDGKPAPAVEATVVDVQTDGNEKHLILVREPRRGDLLLKIGDTMWLRPRRLHRLTRLSPELRMFSGAAISDVASIDVSLSYRTQAAVPQCLGGTEYVLDLTAARARTRYPRVRYRIGCSERIPRRLEFMTASGTLLKSVVYRQFASVLDARIATVLEVHDHVLRDTAVVELSDFAFLPEHALDAYTPAYLLSLVPAVD